MFLASPAFAACKHYAGHLDLEGKIGNNRNIGEASAFLPVACTQDRLLFTDLKFRADNLSNREANIGIGGRVQHEGGIAGGYIYFDRKKSGETDKFYNQITTGAEWLADHWETRANVYIPLNGSKTIGSGVVVSDPYLAGTGIYIDRGGFQIKETPMYGADAEIGFQTTENLWLYGGGFTFHGNDVPAITGGRVRAKYDLTEKVSLNAEGQYDDERGRQGWLGARLSVPFGNANAARSRMTQSPVRDVDIVTQTKQQQTFKTTSTLANPESGNEQRVIYVDNRAEANGDGSLEKPYSTLADAQSDLRDYDIVYIFHGDGTTKGQDEGFVINKDNVSFIGEGSPLTFAGYTLLQAGDKPVITNTQSSSDDYTGNGILGVGQNTRVEGIAVSNAEGSGIAFVGDGIDLGNITVNNAELMNNGVRGFTVFATNDGKADQINIQHVQADHNGNVGIRFHAIGAEIADIKINDVQTNYNANAGIGVYIGGVSTLETVGIKRAISNYNGAEGIIVSAGGLSSDGGRIKNVTISDSEITGSSTINISLRSIRGAAYTYNSDIDSIIMRNVKSYDAAAYNIDVHSNNFSNINNLEFYNVDSQSGATGLRLRGQSNANLKNAKIVDSNFLSNRYGIYLNDDTNGDFEIAVTGNNRLFGNTIADVMLDLDGETVDMRNNWWGQDTGPQAGQIINEDSGSNTGTALVSPWLTADPRP